MRFYRFLLSFWVVTLLYATHCQAQVKRRKPKVESTKRAKNQPLMRAKPPLVDISDDAKLKNRTPIEPSSTEQASGLPKFEMRRMRKTDLLQKNEQVKIPPRLLNEQRLVTHEMRLRRSTDDDFGSQPQAHESKESIADREIRWNRQAGEIVAGLKRNHKDLRKVYKVDLQHSDYHGNLIRRKHHNSDQTRADIALNYKMEYSVKITKKDLHPSAAYLSIRYATSYAEIDAQRLKAFSRSERQKHRKKNQPRYLRKKLKDLEYDKNEVKIWTPKTTK